MQLGQSLHADQFGGMKGTTMKVQEASLSPDLQGSILKPAEQTGWGVVVLAGSSCRVGVVRAKLFAGLGAVCIALRWFGGERQPPGICEVPLEVFTRTTDRLIEEGCERVAYVGTSKGAEAALLIATDDPRVRVVAAISPSSVVWANIGPGIDGVAWPQHHHGRVVEFRCLSSNMMKLGERRGAKGW
jgi:uncharacterized protein